MMISWLLRIWRGKHSFPYYADFLGVNWAMEAVMCCPEYTSVEDLFLWVLGELTQVSGIREFLSLRELPSPRTQFLPRDTYTLWVLVNWEHTPVPFFQHGTILKDHPGLHFLVVSQFNFSFCLVLHSTPLFHTGTKCTP
jgi:hypothetical protein